MSSLDPIEIIRNAACPRMLTGLSNLGRARGPSRRFIGLAKITHETER
jgi:hypothetical protein